MVEYKDRRFSDRSRNFDSGITKNLCIKAIIQNLISESG